MVSAENMRNFASEVLGAQLQDFQSAAYFPANKTISRTKLENPNKIQPSDLYSMTVPGPDGKPTTKEVFVLDYFMNADGLQLKVITKDKLMESWKLKNSRANRG